jgi:hypothetical protein
MKQNQTTQLFVYGSLRSGFHSSAYNYVSRYFTLVGEAKAKGLLYDMGDYPVGVACKFDTFVVGELYQIKHKEAFDFAIAQLDDYEGLNGEDHEDILYERTLTEIFVNETATKAWTYWYKGDTANKPVIASGDVLQYFEQKKNS